MSTDRKIAWFGVGLSALGLIPVFRDANVQLIVAYCAAFVSLLGFFLYDTYRTSRPQFTTLQLKKELTVDDGTGELAHLVREQKICVNYGSIQEIWCYGIYADGTVDTFEVDGDPVPQFDQIWSGPIVDLRKRFSEPYFSGHEALVPWTYDLHKAFTAKHETLDHEVTPGTRELEMIVHLPADRVCIRTSLHLLVGGEPVGQMADPEISSDWRTLRARIKPPKSGHKLRLSWGW